MNILWKVWLVVCLGGLVCMPRASASGGASSDQAAPLPSPLKFKHLGLDQGLSQSSVQAMLQDSLGFLWFGTQDGLNRYNGYTFTVFGPEPSSGLNDRWIFDLAEDPSGGIWIATQSGGLNRYDTLTGAFTHYQHAANNPDSLASNTVCALLVDRQGTLWLGTDAGLERFDQQRSRFIHYQHDPENPASLSHNHVHTIYEDQAGLIWVGTELGVDRLDPLTGTVTRIAVEGEAGLTYRSVKVIYQDSQGDLWVGTRHGLNRLAPGADRFEQFLPDAALPNALPHGNIGDIQEDGQGNLWIGTSNGLSQFDRDSQRFISYQHEAGNVDSLTDSVILSLYLDREGLLWIGTYGGGINLLDPGKIKFPHYQHNPFDPASIAAGNVFQMAEDQQGNLWLGLYGNGLDRFDRAVGQFFHYRHDPEDSGSLLSDFVYGVHVDRQGTIWVGSEMGLDALDAASDRFTHYVHNPKDPHSLGSYSVLTILSDSQGDVWLGTRDGLDRFAPDTGQFIHYRHDPHDLASISPGTVVCLFETRQGDLWIGMQNSGLNRFDPQTGGFEHFSHDPADPRSLSNNTVLAIYQDAQGALWLGTGNGLDQYDPQTGVVKRYTTADGLPNNVIYAIVEDGQGYFWLSTNNGLARFDRAAHTFEAFDQGDGLQSREFNMNAGLRTRSGEIVFGGVNGINLFDPAAIQANAYVPPVRLTSLTQGGQPLAVGQSVETVAQITLHWPYNYFEFEFAALSYAETERNQYTYWLEKFDQARSPISSRRFGRYTNLPGGVYTLHVIGSNNDGVWNETGLSIVVRVVPAFWQAWWFRGALAGLLAVGVYAGYRWRLRSMRVQNRELERQVMARAEEIKRLFERTKDLAIIEERNRLARDLHDSAKQKAFAALAQLGTARGVVQRDVGNAQAHLDEAENLVYEVIQELTFLIQEMYPLALQEKGLVAVLKDYLYEWENRNEVQVDLEVIGERRLPLQIEQALYRIVQEGLANIARHSQAARAVIRLEYTAQEVHMSLSDDGCGFNLAQKPTGVGLRSMQERATMINGHMQIDTSPGHGTCVRISAPAALPAGGDDGDHGGQNGASTQGERSSLQHPDR